MAKALARASGRAAAAAFHRWIDALRRRRETTTRRGAGAAIRREASKPRRSRRAQGVGDAIKRSKRERHVVEKIAARESRLASRRFGRWAHRVEDLRRERRVVEKIAARWSRLALAETFACWAHRVEDLRRERRVVEKIAARWSRLALAEFLRVLGSSRRGSARGSAAWWRQIAASMVALALADSALGSSRRGSAAGTPRGGEDRREMVAFARRSLRLGSRRGSAAPAACGEYRRGEIRVLGWAHRVEDLRRERRVVEKIAARWSRLALAEAFACWRKARPRRRASREKLSPTRHERDPDRRRAPPRSTRGSKTRGRRSGIVERSKRSRAVGGVSVGSGARFSAIRSKRWRRRRG